MKRGSSSASELMLSPDSAPWRASRASWAARPLTVVLGRQGLQCSQALLSQQAVRYGARVQVLAPRHGRFDDRQASLSRLAAMQVSSGSVSKSSR